MNTELMQLWERMHVLARGTQESFIELNQLTARSIERVARQGFAFASDCAALAVRGWRISIAAKDTGTVLGDETRLAAEYGKTWAANAQRWLEISRESQNDLEQWLTHALQRWQGQKTGRPCTFSGRREKTFIVDDPMLALITRFVCGGEQLRLSQGEFILDQIATIQRYVEQFPEEQRNERAIEWIEQHAERYRQAWQKRAVYAQAAQARCSDCPLAAEGCTEHCEIHQRWLELLRGYIAGEVSSRRYVENTLLLLTDHKTRLKVSGLRGPGDQAQASWAQGLERATQAPVACAQA